MARQDILGSVVREEIREGLGTVGFTQKFSPEGSYNPAPSAIYVKL